MFLLKIESQKHKWSLLPSLMMLQVVSRDYHVITNNNVVECWKPKAQVMIAHTWRKWVQNKKRKKQERGVKRKARQQWWNCKTCFTFVTTRTLPFLKPSTLTPNRHRESHIRNSWNLCEYLVRYKYHIITNIKDMHMHIMTMPIHRYV